MISRSDIQPVGKFLKPHGINGEIAVMHDSDDIDFNDYSCVITDVDGIFVPFFLKSIRHKGADTDLFSIEGISDESKAGRLSNKTVYVLRSEIPSEENEEDDGFYAEDLIGHTVILAGNKKLGKIIGIEDTTANYLFIVETPDGKKLLIPVADEFVSGIDSEHQEIEMDLPKGLVEIQE